MGLPPRMKAQTVADRQLVFLVAGRDPSVPEWREELESLAKERSLSANAVEFKDMQAAAQWMKDLPKGQLHILILVPALQTWARLPYLNKLGQPPVRSAEFIWGLPQEQHDNQRFETTTESNREILNSIELLNAALNHSPAVVSLLLHPEDLGYCGDARPASLWQLVELRQLALKHGMFRSAKYQCECGESEFRAPIGILSARHLGPTFAKGWPKINDDTRTYLGPLRTECNCGQNHVAMDKSKRSSRVQHSSFVTKAFRRSMAKRSIEEVLKLGLVGGAEKEAGLGDNEASASGTETQIASEGENLLAEGARPYRWLANEAEQQVDR